MEDVMKVTHQHLTSELTVELPHFITENKHRPLTPSEKRWTLQALKLCDQASENSLVLVKNNRVLAEVAGATDATEAYEAARAQIIESYGKVLPMRGVIAALNFVPRIIDSLHLAGLGVDILLLLKPFPRVTGFEEVDFADDWLGRFSQHPPARGLILPRRY